MKSYQQVFDDFVSSMSIDLWWRMASYIVQFFWGLFVVVAMHGAWYPLVKPIPGEAIQLIILITGYLSLSMLLLWSKQKESGERHREKKAIMLWYNSYHEGKWAHPPLTQNDHIHEAAKAHASVSQARANIEKRNANGYDVL
jgi:hypothetical protein